jgi:hypothetical protein
MTANASRVLPDSSAAGEKRTTQKRLRGTYRRHLTAAGPEAPNTRPEARRAAAVILEVLAGVRTPASAAAALGIRLPRYYLLEERAIHGLIAACAPRPRGRTASTDRRLAQLERALAQAQRELVRHQALARTTQRALGLSPPAGSSPPPAGMAQRAPGETKRRRRKPSVRALRAARLLRGADSPGGETSAAVQKAAGSPGSPESVDGGIQPAAPEAICS